MRRRVEPLSPGLGATLTIMHSSAAGPLDPARSPQTPSMETIFVALAARHDGIFTRRQALLEAISDRDLQQAVRRGVLRRLRHGCYALKHDYDRLDAVQQHLLLARAVVMCQFGTVALTGPSAAALHGLSTYGLDLDTVHLVRLDRGSSRHRVDTSHQVLTHDISRDLVVVGGLPAVSVARTVWEVATVSSVESAVCVADTALRMHPEIAGDLMTIAGTFGRRPGSHRARAAMALADGRSGSEGETLSRILFARHGIPEPELQYNIVDADGVLIAVTDFGWEGIRHVGEFDGKIKYTRFLRPGEEPGDVVFREKQREDAVRGEGFGMTRWTWRDLMPSGAPEFLRRLSSDLNRSAALNRQRSA